MNETPESAPKTFASTVSSDLLSDAGLLLTSTRYHWSFNNSVHWVLYEDDSRTSQGQAQHDLTILLRLALKPFRKEKSAKTGIPARCKRAGRITDCHLKVFPNKMCMPNTQRRSAPFRCPACDKIATEIQTPWPWQVMTLAWGIPEGERGPLKIRELPRMKLPIVVQRRRGTVFEA